MEEKREVLLEDIFSKRTMLIPRLLSCKLIHFGCNSIHSFLKLIQLGLPIYADSFTLDFPPSDPTKSFVSIEAPDLSFNLINFCPCESILSIESCIKSLALSY